MSSATHTATPPAISPPASSPLDLVVGSIEMEKEDQKQKRFKVNIDEDESTGPFYDEDADLKDELWVNKRYLSHQAQPPKKRPTKGAATTTTPRSEAQGDGNSTEQQQQQQQKKKKKKRPEDWTSDHNDPLTRARRTDAVLSCPCCFTPLCYDCQRHDTYVTQYRAMFVTEECSAHLGEVRLYDTDRYHPVFCSICETEVGVLEPADEIYHFYNVIPGT